MKPNPEPEYIQLSSWEELVEWIEREGKKIMSPPPPPKPVRRKKKAPPQKEGLF